MTTHDDTLVALAKAVEDAKASLAAANTSTEVWTRGKALRSAREALAEACEAPAVLLSLVERVQRAEKDAKLFNVLRDAYVGADFRDEQFPDQVVLKFSFGDDMEVSCDLVGTLASKVSA